MPFVLLSACEGRSSWCIRVKVPVIFASALTFLFSLSNPSEHFHSTKNRTKHNTTTSTMETVQKVIGKVTGQHTLPTAKLGKNGPQVPRIGYGTMGLVSGDWNSLCFDQIANRHRRAPSTAPQSRMKSASRSSTRSTRSVISSGTLPTCTRTAKTFSVCPSSKQKCQNNSH